MIRRGTMLFLLAFASGLPLLAHASGPRVAIVTDDADVPLVRRLDAELRAAGMVSVLTPHDRSVLDAARRARADAAIKVALSGTAVWVLDPSRARVARFERIAARLGDDDRDIALRTVELVRATLAQHQRAELQIGLDQPPTKPRPRPAAAPPAVRRTAAAARAPTFNLEAMVGATATPGSMPVAGQLWLGVGYYVESWWIFEVVGALPMVSPEVYYYDAQPFHPEGFTSRFVPYFLGGGLRLIGHEFWSRLRGTVGLGAGVLIATLESPAGPDHDNTEETFASFAGYVRAGLSLRLGWGLSAQLSGLLGLQAHELALAFPDRSEVIFEPPFFSLALGVALAI